MMYNRVLKKMGVLFAKCIVPLFYDKKYLKGRFFNERSGGWYWCLRGILWQKILGFNRNVPWPVNHMSTIQDYKNIEFDVDDINIFQTFGCYYQNNYDAKIVIGKGSYIAPNVGIITTNHDISDLDKHYKGEDVIIGKKCWIGMNSVILPGVVLGDRTIVGAGSVVTKSFKEGKCIIAGVPAKVIKKLDD